MVKALYLDENNMTGPINTDLSALTGLEYLVMGGNQFSGTVPADLGRLTTLVQLVLRWNFLTGKLNEKTYEQPASLGMRHFLSHVCGQCWVLHK